MAARTDKLTKQQEQFVQCLLLDTQRVAYRKAYPKSLKWTDKTVDESASRLFRQNKVFARYNELMDKTIKEAEEESIFTVKQVLKEIKDLLDTDITDIVEISTEEQVVRVDGVPAIKEDGSVLTEWVQNIRMKDTEEMTPAALRSISEIGYNRYGIYVKRYDKQKTIELAGKHLKLFTEKVEHSGEINIPPINIKRGK